VLVEKLQPISDLEWNEVNEFNRFIWDDFLTNSVELSPKSRKSYYSNLRIWFIWVKDNLNNKSQLEVTPLEFKRFQNWLVNRGCSSSDVYNKRAAISSLNNYIEIYYQSDYPTFRNFINKSIKRPPKAFVHPKEPLTKAEFEHLISELEKQEEWQKIAYLRFTLESGCRRAESRQILKDIVDSKPISKTKTIQNKDGSEKEEHITIYQTPLIRCKGKGTTGKVRKLTFDEETMVAFKKWLEVRGDDDCPYMFVTKYGGKVNQISESGFNSWSRNTFEHILGRRFHPHLLRESRATQAVVEEGKDIETVKTLLGHESSETTKIYVIKDDSDDVTDLF